MIGRAGLSSKCWRVLRWAGLAAAAPALWACTSRTLETPTITPTATLTTNFTQKINNEIDILFMVDNSSSMTEMQQKLGDQLADVHERASRRCKNPPSLHVAVVSSDMGAPGDSTSSIKCTPVGDQGQFQNSPRTPCTATTLTAGDTFIDDQPAIPMSNFTDPSRRCFSASRSSAIRAAGSSTSWRQSIARSAVTGSRPPAGTPTSCAPRPTSASCS